ncbi:hypothetical protein KDM41_10245 [bacterium]|nr:hypothetical protein [bacterium]
MTPTSMRLRCAGALLGLLLAGGVQAASPAAMNGDKVEPLAEYVSPADSLPQLRYFCDGLITLNDRCPVRKVRLNPKMGASYVNGRPVGFC